MTLQMVQALAGPAHYGPVVHLLGPPHVTGRAGSHPVASGGGRLPAFLSLHREYVDRGYVGSLWPDVFQTRAAGNLWSALNRLNTGAVPLVTVEHSGMCLREEVLVDIRLLGDWDTRGQLRLAIVHLDRAHLPPAAPPAPLGKLAPIEYKMLYTTAALAA